MNMYEKYVVCIKNTRIYIIISKYIFKNHEYVLKKCINMY